MVAKVAPPLLVIVGPTASGKSDLALKVAQEFNGEIICGDSWTIRKGMDIGTAKPSMDDQKKVRHHLLDIIEPCEVFSAGQFKNRANTAIADILSRSKLPILVGGSGLYIDGVIYDFGFIKADKAEREKLNQMTKAELISHISKAGLKHEGIDLNNKRRLIRLIEKGGVVPTNHPLRQGTLIIGLKPTKEQLIMNITSRTERMINLGLEREVATLVNKYSWSCEGLKGINYAQWRPYFEGRETIEKVKQNLIKANLYLAKKQTTWFKRNNSIHWLTTPVKRPDVVEIISTNLGT